MMANWFPKQRRGIVMSWWTTNYVLGSFLATLFAAYIATSALPLAGTGWQRAFWAPAVLLLMTALLYYVGVRETPSGMNIDAGAAAHPDGTPPDDPQPSVSIVSDEPAAASSYFRVVTSPVVLVIACGCLFAKITRYAFLFWLPLYMTEQLHYRTAEAGYTSGVFELAGFVGAIAAGYLSDNLFGSRRFPVSACMFWMLSVMCMLEPLLARRGHWLNAVGIALIGIANYGPDTLLQGAASQDAGSGLGTGVVSGFISGVGSIGQLISPYLVALVTEHYGWNVLFHLFVAVAFIGGVQQALLWNYGKTKRVTPKEILA
jgi:sugar phosphate permease